MECPNQERMMKSFDERNLPNFDVFVPATIRLFMRQGVPRIELIRCQKPLTMANRIAVATGRILLAKSDAVFANDSILQTSGHIVFHPFSAIRFRILSSGSRAMEMVCG